MSRESWLEHRRTGIGGSDIAAIARIPGAWGSPLSVYADKIGLEVPEVENGRMYVGRVTEPAVLAIAKDKHPELSCYLRPSEIALECAVSYEDDEGRRIYRRDGDSWCTATVDAFALIDGEPAVVDAKHLDASAKREHEEEPAGMPGKYYAQLQWYMYVTGLKRAALACLFGNEAWSLTVVDRDEPYIAQLAEIAAEFWDHVVRQEQPELVGSKYDEAALRVIHKRDDGGTVELPVGLLEYDEAYQRAAEGERDAKARKEAAKVAIMSAIGDARTGTLPNGRSYSWTTSVGRSISLSMSLADAAAYLEALRELPDEYRQARVSDLIDLLSQQPSVTRRFNAPRK